MAASSNLRSRGYAPEPAPHLSRCQSVLGSRERRCQTSHCIKISRHSTPIEQSKNLRERSSTTLQEPQVRSSTASATTPPSPPCIFRHLRHPSPPRDANGACFVVLGHRFMWSPQRCIISLSRSSRRKVETIASVFLAVRVAVQLLLLLLVFQ